MNVSRNYPKTELVIKRVHGDSAALTLKKIRDLVKWHNRHFTPKNYCLIEPKAYAIDDYLVAMAKTNAPTIEQLGDELLFEEIRGRKTRRFKKLQEKYSITKERIPITAIQRYPRPGFIFLFSNSTLGILGLQNLGI
jgi:hypothetical protein